MDYTRCKTLTYFRWNTKRKLHANLFTRENKNGHRHRQWQEVEIDCESFFLLSRRKPFPLPPEGSCSTIPVSGERKELSLATFITPRAIFLSERGDASDADPSLRSRFLWDKEILEDKEILGGNRWDTNAAVDLVLVSVCHGLWIRCRHGCRCGTTSWCDLLSVLSWTPHSMLSVSTDNSFRLILFLASVTLSETWRLSATHLPGLGGWNYTRMSISGIC